MGVQPLDDEKMEEVLRRLGVFVETSKVPTKEELTERDMLISKTSTLKALRKRLDGYTIRNTNRQFIKGYKAAIEIVGQQYGRKVFYKNE